MLSPGWKSMIKKAFVPATWPDQFKGFHVREEKVYIKNDSLIIEGLLYKGSGKKGVVICHPHSLMGGSMYNNVVEALQEVFAAESYFTLRFNFRGVGASSGTYEEGRGEKKDIRAVCEYLKQQGLTEISFAGYSFGAWVGSMIIEEKDNPFSSSILISPPINLFNFNWNHLKNKVDLIVSGDCDQFCDLDLLISEAGKINSRTEAIDGADHFYMGKENELKRVLQKKLVK
jgi:uncharacterized protein